MEVVLGFGLFLFVKDLHYQRFRRRPSELLLGKGALKIYRKFTGEHPCWSAILTKLHMCSPVNLQHIFRTPFYKITSGGVLLPLAAILMFFFYMNECLGENSFPNSDRLFGSDDHCPSRHFFVESQKQKHQNSVPEQSQVRRLSVVFLLVTLDRFHALFWFFK